MFNLKMFRIYKLCKFNFNINFSSDKYILALSHIITARNLSTLKDKY